jgi:HD-like signal output (HDOD) protein
VIGNSVRNLLNVDMQPYGITPDKFAEISSLQASLMLNWMKKIDRQKAEKLYLATLLQETGKILIASYIIQEDETTTFASEIEMTNNIAMVEKSYVDVTSAEVTALVFKHWGFDDEFIQMIKYADTPASAPDDIKEFSIALNIVKTAIPINKPLSEMAINFALKKARDAGYNHEVLEDSIDDILDIL